MKLAPISEPVRDARALGELARRSLGGPRVGWLLPVFLALVVVGFVGALLATGSFWIALVPVYLVLGALAFYEIVVRRRLAARELAWLAALPFPFSHAGYVALLDDSGSSHTLTLIVELRAPQTVAYLEAAAEGRALRINFKHVGGRVFEVSSPGMQTRFESSDGKFNRTWNDNTDVHQWLRSLVAFFVAEGLVVDRMQVKDG